MTTASEKAARHGDFSLAFRIFMFVLAGVIWLALPGKLIISQALFDQGWQARSTKIKSVLCEAYRGDAEKDKCAGDALSSAFVLPERDSFFTTATLTIRLENPAFFVNGAQSRPTDPANRCGSLDIAIFSVSSWTVSQDATYDSIARQIEACSQFERPEQLVLLCSGTRDALDPKFCRKSLNFLQQMKDYDRSTEGRQNTVKLILANIIFGMFQTAALVLLLVGLSVGILRRLRVGAEPSKVIRTRVDRKDAQFRPGSWTSAADAAYYARIHAQDQQKPKRMQSYILDKEAYLRDLSRGFDRLSNWGDIIVLTGLLGTLWGMLILFSALAESGSAEPLTAELAKSKMLGSLGLAFGTTIFAGVLRLIFLFTLPKLASDAQRNADKLFMRYLTDVDVSGRGDDELVDDVSNDFFGSREDPLSYGYSMIRSYAARRSGPFKVPLNSVQKTTLPIFLGVVMLGLIAAFAGMYALGEIAISEGQ